MNAICGGAILLAFYSIAIVPFCLFGYGALGESMLKQILVTLIEPPYIHYVTPVLVFVNLLILVGQGDWGAWASRRLGLEK
jgi:hypothetical protein